MTEQTPTPPAPQTSDGRINNPGRIQPGQITNPEGRAVGAVGARQAITYDSLIEYLIQNPRATNKDLAAAFGYSPTTISIIINSDAFKQRYEKRRSDVVDPLLTMSIEARLSALADKSAEIVAEQLELNPLDKKFALQVLERTMPQKEQAKGPAVNLGFIVNLPGPAASTSEWQSKFGPSSATMVMPRVEEAPSEALRSNEMPESADQPVELTAVAEWAHQVMQEPKE